MAWKHIVVQVDDALASLPRYAVAAELARVEEAHLEGVALPPGTAGIAAPTNGSLQRGFQHFTQAAHEVSVTSTAQRSLQGDAALALSREGRHADLLVMGQCLRSGSNQTNGKASGEIPAADFAEFVIVNSGCPVLVVPVLPPRHDADRPFWEEVLIGWNGSASSARAVRDALPLLARARTVHVAVLQDRAPGTAPVNAVARAPGGPSANGMAGETAGAELAVWLDRHGIAIEVHHRAAVEDAGNALLELAHRLRCGMLVMGGVAHPHAAGLLPGGATRAVLIATRIPVLMSH